MASRFSRNNPSNNQKIKINNWKEFKDFFNDVKIDGQNNNSDMQEYNNNNNTIKKNIDELIIYEEYFKKLMDYFKVKNDNILFDNFNPSVEQYIIVLNTYYNQKPMTFFDVNMLATQQELLSILLKKVNFLKQNISLEQNDHNFIKVAVEGDDITEPINPLLSEIFKNEKLKSNNNQNVDSIKNQEIINKEAIKLTNKKKIYEYFTKPIILEGLKLNKKISYPLKLQRLNEILNKNHDVTGIINEKSSIIIQSINDIMDNKIKNEIFHLFSNNPTKFFQFILGGIEDYDFEDKPSLNDLIGKATDGFSSVVAIINKIKTSPNKDFLSFQSKALEHISNKLEAQIKMAFQDTSDRLKDFKENLTDPSWSDSVKFLNIFDSFQKQSKGSFSEYEKNQFFNSNDKYKQYEKSYQIMNILYESHWEDAMNQFRYNNRTEINNKKLSGQGLNKFLGTYNWNKITEKISKFFKMDMKIPSPIKNIEDVFKLKKDYGYYCLDFSMENINKTKKNLMDDQKYFDDLLLNIQLIDIKRSQIHISNSGNFSVSVQEDFMIVQKIIEDVQNYYANKDKVEFPRKREEEFMINKLIVLDLFMKNPYFINTITLLKKDIEDDDKIKKLLESDYKINILGKENQKTAFNSELSIYSKALIGGTTGGMGGAAIMKMRQNLKKQGDDSKTLLNGLKTIVSDKNVRDTVYDNLSYTIKKNAKQITEVSAEGLKKAYQVTTNGTKSTVEIVKTKKITGWFKNIFNK